MQINKLIAVLEIWNNAIAQTHTYENGSIDEIEGLPEAIDKWAQRNGVSYSIKELIEGW